MRINNPREIDKDDIAYIEGLVERVGNVGLPLDSVTFWIVDDCLVGTSLRYKNHHDLRPIAQIRQFYIGIDDVLVQCLDSIHLHELIEYHVGRYVSLVKVGGTWTELVGEFDHLHMRGYNSARISIERNLRKRAHAKEANHGTLLSDHTTGDAGLPGAEGFLSSGFGQPDQGGGDGPADGGNS